MRTKRFYRKLAAIAILLATAIAFVWVLAILAGLWVIAVVPGSFAVGLAIMWAVKELTKKDGNSI